MKILLVDDEELIRVTLGDLLKDHGHEVTLCDNGALAIGKLKTEPYDLLITDLRLPKAGGIEVLTAARQALPQISALLITAYGSHETSLEAMRLGAEYVTKPFLNDDILLRVQNIERTRVLADENQRLKSELKKRYGFEQMVGASAPMRQVFDLIKSVARNDFSVLILGESGTGKELVATSLHYNSPRADKPLIRVSCAALPENLLEDEMFGHEKGAFTDARERKPGRFELADGGSLFLDDIDDMPLALQVKLLRVLQEREIERLGGTKPIRINIRIIAATKVNLADLVKQGKFREDLYYRLNVVPLRLPPLRGHLEDLEALIDHFVKLHGSGKRFRLSPATFEFLRKHRWPGNIRELENAVQRAIALAADGQLELAGEHLVPAHVPMTAVDQAAGFDSSSVTNPAPTAQATSPVAPAPVDSLTPPPLSSSAERLAVLEQLVYPKEVRPLKEVLHQLEALYLRHVLDLSEENRTKAADLLGISRKNLWEKLRDLGISTKE
ncbi:MAG TPA: sigma-54 dependent transcriptional regulator [Planctomycetota bacterium]|nr:sigma-54 dependent transcriptional regulator [Planctomycetota bacterium]